MATNSVQVGIEAAGVSVRQRISISRWVNEPYPAWDQILTAHDVARLVRRPSWALRGMAAIGRFPRKQRFHGRRIGWLQSDVLAWLEKESRITRGRVDNAPPLGRQVARHTCLAPECSPTRAVRKHRRRGCRRWTPTYRRLQSSTRIPVR